MAEGKWITGLASTATIVEAASAVLSVRLSAVAHVLPMAAEKPTEDVEHVHQLRVTTRRASAALRIFRDVCHKKEHKRTRNLLRSLRNAAGAARDWDVLIQQCSTNGTAECTAAMEFLEGFALCKRIDAQVTLVDVTHQCRDQFAQRVISLDELFRDTNSEHFRFGTHAKQVLHELFHTFCHEIQANPTTPEALHQLRILGKRLRYTIEVVAGLFDPVLRDVMYPQMEELQEILGTIQDNAVFTQQLDQILNSLGYLADAGRTEIQSGLEAWKTKLHESSTIQKQHFQEWLITWQEIQANGSLAALDLITT